MHALAFGYLFPHLQNEERRFRQLLKLFPTPTFASASVPPRDRLETGQDNVTVSSVAQLIYPPFVWPFLILGNPSWCPGVAGPCKGRYWTFSYSVKPFVPSTNTIKSSFCFHSRIFALNPRQ